MQGVNGIIKASQSSVISTVPALTKQTCVGGSMARKSLPKSNLNGQKFNQLLVIGAAPAPGQGAWLCRCDCGAYTVTRTARIKSGTTKSCGCLRRTKFRQHGLSQTPEYMVWAGMKARCLNPRHSAYKRYGGRGITVCDRWMSLENFYADMGPRPSAQHTLERIDNDKGYSPDNCRWASRSEQSNNRSSCHLVTAFGKTQTIAQWASECGVAEKLLRDRIERGWDFHRAINTPRLERFVNKAFLPNEGCDE